MAGARPRPGVDAGKIIPRARVFVPHSAQMTGCTLLLRAHTLMDRAESRGGLSVIKPLPGVYTRPLRRRAARPRFITVC